jgi:ATP-dependent helicase/nuclease subunit A
MSDQGARDRIARELDTNLLVEAGAGSGKTTSLVGRLCALVERGIPVEQIAAVTFTRKAAAELRERFQMKLEQQIRLTTAPAEGTLLETALRDLDRAFLGTIHAFAARLLREQALEAGVDPTFEELDEAAMRLDQERFWQRWLEQCRVEGHRGLADLRGLGIDPRDLLEGFIVVGGNPDVAWPAPETDAPDATVALSRLRKLLKESWILMPAEEPADGWDKLQGLVRELHFVEQTRDLAHLPDAMHALGLITSTRCAVVQKRWSEDKETKQEVKRLAAAWQDFLATTVTPLLEAWREHRYAPVIRFLAEAADAFQRERRRTGRLGFEDLLVGVAALLRDRHEVRKALGERYRRLLVDEFQDTDPLQAEICFLLASDPAEGNDWRRVRPRPGGLFVVGDPKQSIYRFRRADLRTYDAARRRFAEVGDVLLLTRNFRSVTPIADLVNSHFAGVFPAGPSETQAPFAPMETVRAPAQDDGVHRYLVTVEQGRGTKDAITRADADGLSAWIAGRVEAGANRPGDFLVLTQRKAELAAYATALAGHNIPVTTTGAELRQEHELTELVLLLRLLADPANPVLLVAVLEGLFVGLSPEALYAARRAGVALNLTNPSAPGQDPVLTALGRLRGWWLAARRLPPDQLLDRLLDETGLLAWAASQPLGEERAGALLHLVESVRRSERGMTDLRGTIEVLEEALAVEEGAPVLRPGRSDAVRVMNLHKAKGLEAEVVVLAAPLPSIPREPSLHISRGASGDANGWLRVQWGEGNSVEVLAQPPGWSRLAQSEATLLEAERDRLLYVATTRARRMLVVAQRVDGMDSGLWGRIAPALQLHARELPMRPRPTPGRRRLELGAEVIAARVAAATVGGVQRSAGGYEVRSVTRALRQNREEERQYNGSPATDGRPGGRARGDAIHRVLEAQGRGRTGESLERFARAVLTDLGLPDEALVQVLAAAEGVTALPEWHALQAGRAEYELPVMRAEEVDGVVRITEGVIDAVVEQGGVWRVLDWKTGRTEGEAWEQRLPQYEAQVARYQDILRAAGLPAEGAVVVRIRGT